MNNKIGGITMDKLEEYSYLWESDNYVIFEDEVARSILLLEGGEMKFFLLEDEFLNSAIINKMLELGCKRYGSIEEIRRKYYVER
ncbi:MAG: hypothetical protein IJA07_10430 [Agathobacter sp.]|nr:hypothetical protein [Agathobacter sp.]